MGFFSNIFKKKKGGTVVGNFIRGVASTATGGVLGSGVGLANWEAEQEAKKDAALKAELKDLRRQIDSKQLGADLVNSAVSNGVASKQSSPNMGENIVLETLKKHWYWFAGAMVVLALLIWFFTTQKGNKINSRILKRY